MHTVRCSDRCWGGCTCPGGVPAQGVYMPGVYLLGGTCLGRSTCLGGVPARGVYLPMGCTCLGVYLPWGGCTCLGVYLPGWCTCLRGVYLPGGCTCLGVYLPGWCTCLRGCTCPGGVPAPGVVYLLGVRVCIPACTEADTPPVNRMTDRCKNITLPHKKLNLKMCDSTICTILEFFNLCHWQLEMKDGKIQYLHTCDKWIL